MAIGFMPPGARGYLLGEQLQQQQQDRELGQLAQIYQMIEQSRTAPLRRKLLESQIAENASQNEARAQAVIQAKRREKATADLARLLSTGGYEPGPGAAPLTGTALTDADALRQVQAAEAQGLPANVGVPSPANVRALAIQAGSPQAVTELLKQEKPEKPSQFADIHNVAEGYLRRYPDGRVEFVSTKGKPELEKPKPGYRYKADRSGEQEPIPGGPVDIARKDKALKESNAKKTVTETVNQEIRLIDKMIGTKDGKTKEHPGLTSVLGTIDPFFPTLLKDTADFETLLETLRSKASVNSLQIIRASNAGSIGQITEREWPRLEAFKVGIRDRQSEASFRRNVSEYRDDLIRLRDETNAVTPGEDEPEIPSAGALEAEFRRRQRERLQGR